MPVNEQVVDSVSSANLKALGDAPAFQMGLSYANAVSHQNRLNILAETAVASAIRSVATTPMEEAAGSTVEQHSALPGLISALLAALSSNQQAAKVAQTTPPVTAGT
jgi:hypothetical protein